MVNSTNILALSIVDTKHSISTAGIYLDMFLICLASEVLVHGNSNRAEANFVVVRKLVPDHCRSGSQSRRGACRKARNSDKRTMFITHMDLCMLKCVHASGHARKEFVGIAHPNP